VLFATAGYHPADLNPSLYPLRWPSLPWPPALAILLAGAAAFAAPPPVRTPPVRTPPVRTPPVGAPPADASPVRTPHARTPRTSAPEPDAGRAPASGATDPTHGEALL
jgi:energy-coupling factor transport system permease protein